MRCVYIQETHSPPIFPVHFSLLVFEDDTSLSAWKATNDHVLVCLARGSGLCMRRHASLVLKTHDLFCSSDFCHCHHRLLRVRRWS